MHAVPSRDGHGLGAQATASQCAASPKKGGLSAPKRTFTGRATLASSSSDGR